MNIIQQALQRQNISAAWSGPLPTTVDEITHNYLDEIIDGGLPRMIRSADDHGVRVDITRLCFDYNNILAEGNDEERIAAIKAKAGEVICLRYPIWKQQNLTAKMVKLINTRALNNGLTVEEQEEMERIQSVFTWINRIQEVSNMSELTGVAAEDVFWPL